jgi:Anti-sigma-28 factor, FlgM
MTTDAESKLMTLKERLEQGQYNVDTKKVADAILRNPLWIMLLAAAVPSAERTDQKLCS